MRQYFVKYTTIGLVFGTEITTSTIITIKDDAEVLSMDLVRKEVLFATANKVASILDMVKL